MSHYGPAAGPPGGSQSRAAKLRVMGSALLVGALLISGTGPTATAPAQAAAAAVITGKAAPAIASGGVVTKKRKPKAAVSATLAASTGGKVLLSVASNAKRVQVRYRNASNRKRTASIRIRAGLGAKVLPAGAKAVFVRAKATKKLARSAWVAATAPVPQPTPPPPNPAPNPAPSAPASLPPAPPPPPPAPPAPPPPPPSTSIVSVLADGSPANSDSFTPVLSPDGTRVAFESTASNLVPGDTNATQDIFVKDLVTGAIERVSTASDGAQANGQSLHPTFSPDGTRMAFASVASNLAPSDTNAQYDVFVKSLVTGVVSRISTDALGNQTDGTSLAPAFAPDGTTVAFYSYSTNLVPADTNAKSDIFVKSTTTQAIQRVSTDSGSGQANDSSFNPVISPDGTKVAFYSYATNLVAGDTNATADIFVKSLGAPGDTTRVSTAAGGTQANAISYNPEFSPDSTKVLFSSAATNLVANDTNASTDVFLKTLAFPGAVVRLSTAADGSQGTGVSDGGQFSGDGTKVAFFSASTNLVSGDTNAKSDVFVRTLASGSVMRASTDSVGGQANGDSALPSLSGDGTRVVFYSFASNLVSGDVNAKVDVFLKRLE